MPKTKKHSNLFFKYFVYYCIGIIAILTILGFLLNQFVITQFLQFTKNEYTNNLVVKTSQIKIDLDAIKTTAISAQHMSIGSPYLTYNNPIDKMNAITDLELLSTINPAIDNIALFYGSEPNKVISVAGTMTIDNFARNYMDGNWDGKHLEDEVNKTVGARLLLTDSTNDNIANPQQFMLITNMPFEQENGYGHILFVLNNDFLTKTMENILKKYDFFIQISDNQDNNYIVSSNTENKVVTIEDIQNTKYINDYITLTENIDYNFSYTIGVNKNQLYKEAETIWLNCIIVLCIFSIIGILLSFLIAEKLYRPIRKISESIGQQQNSQNELNFISNSIDSLINIKSKAENIIGDVKNQLFDNLLYHDIHDEKNVTELINFTGINLIYPYFCVIKVFSTKLNGVDCFITQKELSSLIQNYDGIIELHTINQTDCLCVTVNLECNEYDYVKQAFLTDIDNLISLSKTNISIGCIVGDILNVHQSYEDATFVMSCDFFDDNKNIVNIQEAMVKINNNYVYPKIEEKKLIIAILETNVQSVDEITNIIFDKFKYEKINPKILWGIYVSVINNIKNELESKKFNLIDVVYSIKHFTINNYSGYDNLNQNFYEIIKLLISVVATENGCQSNDVINSIYNYINANFQSYDISLNAVSSNVELSPSYVTKLFKDATGYSVKEYIDFKKMQSAKDFLTNTTLSLSEISEKIGFLDTQSFCRKFKSMEGITPSIYKKNSN